MTKPTTIEEVLYDLVWLHANEANALMHIKGWTIEQRNEYVNKHKSEALATIEQLVLEGVIGEDELRQKLPTGGERLQITYRNTMRAKQRQALKRLLAKAGDA